MFKYVKCVILNYISQIYYSYILKNIIWSEAKWINEIKYYYIGIGLNEIINDEYEASKTLNIVYNIK